ncbi:MAG TPA: energy transducer TonB [Rhizomicrobium sp.]|jgi:protein TonB
MDQPLHDLRPFRVGHTPSHRFISIGIVVLLHAVAIWALATGLIQNLASKLPAEFKAEVIPPKENSKPPPPPPPPELQKPPPPFVPPPEISIQTEAAPNTITVSKVPPPPAPPPRVVAPPKPAGVTAPVLIASRGNDCTRDYPAIAVRLNQTGTTLVTVHVGADGNVQGADIADSSGHDSLDQAAIRCVQSRYHFKPAMQSGAPVPQTVQIRVVWKLQG